jgi:hypothetical protein
MLDARRRVPVHRLDLRGVLGAIARRVSVDVGVPMGSALGHASGARCEAIPAVLGTRAIAASSASLNLLDG